MRGDLERRVRELVGRPRGGLAVGVASGGEEAYACFGAARPGGRPVDEDTIFEIGSITKVFTGVLLAVCARDDLVALDDRLSAHLPGHRARVDPTLRELATHASGLPNVTRGLGWREAAFVVGLRARDPHAGVTRADFEAGLARTRTRRRRFRYSSLGVGLLGEALAAAGGRPYEELLRERVLDPLGLEDTDVEPTSLVRLAVGTSGRGKARPPLEDPALVPAGGLRSTARDMLRFLRANLEEDAELAEALALARTPQRNVNRRVAVGLCWLVERRGARLRHWHNGGTWGFRSFAALDRDAGKAVVVLSNRARSVDRLALRLLDRL